MPTTFVGSFILILAVLPGALYTWAFERQVGRWGVGLTDRILRFIGVSSVFISVFAYPVHRLSLEFHRALEREGGAGFLDVGLFPAWGYSVPLLYVAIPIILGSLSGVAVRRRWAWAQVLAGPNPAPRAWDFLFSRRPSGLIRIRLKGNQGWIGGLFG